jgi:hypothetical protein
MTITWKKDAYAGGRCFIFGTGASLAWMDHAKLRQIQLNEFTIGVNGLYRWAGMLKPPDIYCFAEERAFTLYGEAVNQLDTFRVAAVDDPENLREGWTLLKYNREPGLIKGGWVSAEAELTSVAGRSNVIWSMAIQVAYWLGFQDVYLLGVDGEGIHAYELRDVLLHQADGVSPSHRAILNTRQSSEQAFLAYERGDRNLVNLNPDSYVTAIPKMRLEDLAI